MTNISSKIKKAWASLALLSVELLLVAGLFLASLLTFAFLVYRIFRLDRTGLDLRVFEWAAGHTNEANTAFMVFITFFASQQFLLPANLLLIAYFLFVRRHRWYSIKIPVVAIGSVCMMLLLKLYFSRPRPLTPLLEEVKGFSFPSGHAMSAMTFYGLLIYLVYKNVGKKLNKWILILLLGILIFLIGFSRVYLRVHFASDVLAGFSVGIIWLVISIWSLNRIERYTRRKIAPSVAAEPLV